jgi:hypothetical protein
VVRRLARDLHRVGDEARRDVHCGGRLLAGAAFVSSAPPVLVAWRRLAASSNSGTSPAATIAR